MYESYYTAMAKEWDEGIRFFMGQQYIQYSKVGRVWEDIPVTKFNEWMPRPVTNYIAPAVMAIVSLFTRQKPTATIFPNSEDEADKNAAKLSEVIQEAKWELDEEQEKYIKSKFVKLVTGTVFRKDYWDSSIGEPIMMIGEDGVPYESKTGDSAVEYIDPFRMIVDVLNRQFFIEQNVKTVSWVKENYDREGDGYTGYASEVDEQSDLSTVLNIQNALKTESFTKESKHSEDDLSNSTVVYEAYFEPTKRYTRGVLAVVASGKVLYVKDSPYYKPNKKNCWHPYTWDKWINVPHRFHGKSYVKDLIPLQRAINGLDSLIELSLRSMALPQWIIPNGCGVPEGYITGEPALEIRCNPVGSGGLLPTKIDGKGVDPQIWRLREEKLTAFYHVAGTNEIMYGQRPEGVNTASGLNLLLEQTNSKFAPQLQSSEKFIEKGQGRKLSLIAERYKEQRPNFIQQLKRFNRDNLDVQIVNFVGADLRDNIQVKIEAGSSIPKSEAYQQEMLKQLAQFGLFGPVDPMSNPIGNEEFLEKFGVNPIHTEINSDVKRARWINSVLTAVNRGEMAPNQVPPILPYDNLQIHMKVLTDEMKKPEFNDEMGLFGMRAQQIEQILQQQAAQQQMMQQQMQPPGPPQAGPQGIPPQNQPTSNVPHDLGLPVEDMNLSGFNNNSPGMALNFDMPGV